MTKGKIFAYLITFVLFILLQKSFVPILFDAKHLPDIALMLVLVLAIIDGFDNFFWWAIVAGLLYDFLGQTPIGVHVLIFVFVAYFVSFFSRRFIVDARFAGAMLFLFFIVVSTAISHFVLATWISLDARSLQNFAPIFGSGYEIVLEILYNTLLFSLLFLIVRRIKRRKIMLINRQ